MRESDVRPGFFVLSLFKDSSMLHLAVPDKNGKFLRQTLEEACKVVEDIVNSCDGYIHPVPAPSIASNLNDNESGGVQDGTKCYYIPADSLQFMIPVCGNTRDSTSPILISAVRGDCRRCFRTEVELQDHQKLHSDGSLKCDHCEKTFKLRYEKTRHMRRIHTQVMRTSSDIFAFKRLFFLLLYILNEF